MNKNLFSIFDLCSRYKVNFAYETKKNGKNNIEFSETEKKVTILISDPNDDNLDKLLIDKLEYLKQTFNKLFGD